AAWEQGVAAQAFVEWDDAPTAILLAHDAVIRQFPDGRLAMLGSDNAVTDPAASGEALLYAAQHTGNLLFQNAARQMLDFLLIRAPRTAKGVIHHIMNLAQVWIDSMYMAPPFLAVAGHPHEAVFQIEGMRSLLWNQEKRLFSHIWDDGRQQFARQAFWGVGNGWAAAGMTRVIGDLPADMSPERGRLIGYVRDVIDGCLVFQRSDGLFHDVIDDSATFIETNLAQMLAYSIYRGVRGGWLDENYLEAAERMRTAARSQVDEFGWVRGVCGSPMFDRPGVATEGQAFFLLMEVARRDWER
ncbi:MAG: glycoside hydrolase family 88 protein, partial [Chloroflexi bacterium]|nr:glycoside hydrolase family 88 protein [Chloroflexota bacterium]